MFRSPLTQFDKIFPVFSLIFPNLSKQVERFFFSFSAVSPIMWSIHVKENTFMRELKLDTRSCQDEQGTLHIFHYFVLIELSDLFGSCTEQYGIRITEEHGDTASIANITSDITRIHTLLTLLPWRTM